MISRSASGLNALSQFYSVDFVVFCEGGGGTDPSVPPTETPDAIFWSNALRGSLPDGVTCHVSSKGSKTAVFKEVENIRTERPGNVFLALDRDHDEILDRCLDDEFVLYTYGYSFENDICTFSAFFWMWSSFCSNSRESKTEFEKSMKDLQSDLESCCKLVEVDMCQIQKKREGFFPRSSGVLALIDGLQKAQSPRLNKSYYETRLAELGLSRKPRRIVSIHKSAVGRHVYGHFWAKFSFEVVSRAITRIVNRRMLNMKVFILLCSSIFYRDLTDVSQSDDRVAHYRSIGARIGAELAG